MTKTVFLFSLASLLLSSSCIRKAETNSYYAEPYRPQYHFSPDSMWMNDPNGLVFDGSSYHLFYQYHPADIVWGPMHWGHATSSDLVHWQHQPIALYPDVHGTIFSGSAVMDFKNTSGLGTNENPPMVAIFTYHDAVGAEQKTDNFQTQGIAYSLDKGKSWTKYTSNPVVKNSGYVDFRDPKVFWHEATSSWIMALVAGDHLQLYRSENLIDWDLSSTFGHEVGAHGGVWECPDLFALELNGETHWVLLISINPGGPNGGSATQYFLGDFDGYAFASDQKEIKWVDFGPDNYAGVTFNNTPNNKRLFIAWMNNWSYAQNTPTTKWRSASSLPRELSLFEGTDGVRLQNRPIDALEQLKIPKEIRFKKDKEVTYVELPSNQSFISVEGSSANAEFLLINSAKEQIRFTINRNTKKLIIDRSSSGEVQFSEAFTAPIEMDISAIGSETLTLDLWIDTSSVELFINEGKVSATLQYFSNEPISRLLYEAVDGGITVTQIAEIKGIW
jgi:fructan beta-fructosidase